MLKLAGISDPTQEHLEMDYYVPIKVIFDTTIAPTPTYLNPTYYWRTGDLLKSLIEVGIQSSDRRIRSFTLTAADKINFCSCNDQEFAGITEFRGIPIVSLSGWPEGRFKDVPNNFEVNVSRDRVTVLFRQGDAITKFITSDRVRFGINHVDEIVLIDILRLSEDELALLEEKWRGKK